MNTRNPFHGHIFDPRPAVVERAPRPTKRGADITVALRPLNSIADKYDPAVKRAKLLRGSL